MGGVNHDPIDAAVYAETERRLATLLATGRDLLLLQGEAILLLEAAARGLGGPGVRALNLVSGPYGAAIGEWLAVGGADVEQLSVDFDSSIDPSAVARALERGRFDVVGVVHAEAATGVVNPLAEIAVAAHAAGAVVLVDAVASVGAEPLLIDEWDLDLVMVGTQKAMSGPAGVCALIAGERGWARISRNPSAPRNSILSLLDWKEQWIESGRLRIPGYVYEYEMRALIEALDDLEGDLGLAALIERHRRAAAGARAGAAALGLSPWVADERHAASVVTLVRPPRDVSVAALVEASLPALSGDWAGLLTPAPGPLADLAVRINHTGPAASGAAVRATLQALAAGLAQLGVGADLEAALAAADQASATA